MENGIQHAWLILQGFGTMSGESSTTDTPAHPRTKNRINKYLAQPAYNSSIEEVEWVNPMPTFREGQRPNYIKYETGDAYVPVPGPGNSYMNYNGETIQPY